MKVAVERVQAKHAFTERRACRLLLVPVSSFRYKAQRRWSQGSSCEIGPPEAALRLPPPARYA